MPERRSNMKTIVSITLVSAALIAPSVLVPRSLASDGQPIRALVVTGGHSYDTNQFQAVFAAMNGVSPLFVEHPLAHRWMKADRAEQWDILVLYDMWQPATAEARSDFLNRLKDGKGLVAMHHSLASYQDWPQYAQVVGGCYHLEAWEKQGQPRPASTYQHDLDLDVQVLNPWHPVTAGMADFTIHDEGYGKLELKPSVTPLLAVRHPESSPVVAWAKTWQGTRVVGIQLGHDRVAYAHPAFQQLTRNAIHWVARRE